MIENEKVIGDATDFEFVELSDGDAELDEGVDVDESGELPSDLVALLHQVGEAVGVTPPAG